jgi:2-(1,2-epoxy-1,2-dihydrophenyl)acetyl-CoA isomerase
MDADVLFDKTDGRARVIFNRPDVRNALNPEILLAISTFIDDVARDRSIRYLTFEGAGDHFSAGGDLAAYAQTLDQPGDERRRTFERRIRGNFETLLRVQALEKPVVSLLHGAAAGAGISFLLASDFVLAKDDAFLLFAQPRVGLPLDLGVSYFLPRLIGSKAARKLALTGGRLDARQCLALGIVDEIHSAGCLEAALSALAEQFAGVAPRAAGRTKALLLASETRGLAEQMEAEVQAVGVSVEEPDFAEGVRAFLEKRRALFVG